MNLMCLRWTLFLVCLLSTSGADEDHHHSTNERKLKEANIFDNKDTVDLHEDPSFKGDKDINKGKKNSHDHDHSLCGIGDATVDEVANIHKWVSEYKEGSRGDFRINVTVPVCFHVIMTTSGDGALTDAHLQLQVDALNVAFSSSSCCNVRLAWCVTGTCSSETGFRFAMRNDCVTRTVNNDWYYADKDTRADTAMKKTLRVGGPDVLNVYFQDLPGGLLGSAWFPWRIGDRLWKDGIKMDNSAIVGGVVTGRVEGDLLAHEVGHWLGLYHTFQWGCSPSEGVLDTNPESRAARGCPIGRDTCLGGNIGTGRDPIHNFMDYSDDYCMFEFTSDQIDVMHVSHAVYRAERVTREILTLENGVRSEPLTLAEDEMQVYSYELETAGASIICVISYVDEVTGTPCTSDCYNGDADLYLRWGAEPTLLEYDRACSNAGSFERCTSTQDVDDTTLYVGVYASVTFLAVTTTCSEIDNLTPLANNITSAPVSLEEDAGHYFYLPVFRPLANVTCSSSGDSGNADLFLRFDYIPDIVSGLYDCSSSGDGSNEECTLAGVSRGDVFVSVLATSSLSTVTVTCYEVSTLGAIALENGVASDPLSLSRDEEQYYSYSIEISDAMGSVICTTTGFNGDADFLAKWNDPPVHDGNHDCESLGEDSKENCEVDVPFGASTLYILVFASSSFTNIWVTCVETSTTMSPTLTPTDLSVQAVTPMPTSDYGAIVLRNRVPSEYLSLPTDGEQYYLYRWEHPDAIGSVNCTTDGLNGDADLFLKWGDPPVRGGSYDCGSLVEESNESCEVDAPFGASSLYILVYAFSSFTSLRVLCRERVPIVLENEVPSELLSLRTDDEQYYLYPLESPDTTESVTCSTVGSNGDADLIVMWDETPFRFEENFDCSSYDSRSIESCEVDVPFGASALYILVYAYSSFTNLLVTCFETRTTVMPTLAPTQTLGPSVVSSLVPTNLPTMTLAPTNEYGAIDLRNGVPSESLSLSRSDEQYYVYPLESPDTSDSVTCSTVGSNGDADLVLKWNDPPVRFGSFDCGSFSGGSNESCEVDIPLGASKLYILVYAFRTSDDLTVTCTETVTVPIVLANGVRSESLSQFTDGERYFLYPLEFPGTKGSVTCTTVGSNGDADLMVLWSGFPEREGVYDCGSFSGSSNERCNVGAPLEASSLYILVYAWKSFSNLRVICTETPGATTCSRWFRQCSVNAECCSGACRSGRCRLIRFGSSVDAIPYRGT